MWRPARASSSPVPVVVPFGVTRPDVLRFGGATAREHRPQNTFDTTGSAAAGWCGGSTTGSRDRQLRQLRLQPRAVPRRTRRRSRSSSATIRLTVDEALAVEPDAVLLSPGPGRPEDAGIICPVVPAFAERGVPVLGVCLGHQAIGHVYGGSIVHAPSLMHGKTSPIEHTRRRRLSRSAVAADRDPLSQPRDRSGDDAGLPRGHGDLRRCRDGRAPSHAPDRRRAVPPGEHPHRLSVTTCCATSSTTRR